MKCRHCSTDLNLTLVDLGSAPLSNAYLTPDSLHQVEKHYPLRVFVCQNCWLAQTEDFSSSRELFDSDYAYFSGVSTTWLNHCKQFAENVISRFNLSSEKQVVEIAANDGSLLQFFMKKGIKCIGVEPTKSTATAARAKGITIIEDFFGVKLAEKMKEYGSQADLMVANNVLAHVPDINDFTAGFTVLLTPDGVASFEFPHLMNLIAENQFDTIYHEHFSYLSLYAVKRVFESNGLEIFHAETLPTHGGSLRVFAQRMDTRPFSITPEVSEILEEESAAGIRSKAFYQGFQSRVDEVKNELVAFLINASRNGKKVAAYGAAAKGNTLLNYAGVRPDLLSFVADRNPSKQGKYLPGSRIPIVSEERIKKTKPDYILILPWNIRREITEQLSYIREWGAKFLTAIPGLEVL